MDVIFIKSTNCKVFCTISPNITPVNSKPYTVIHNVNMVTLLRLSALMKYEI